MRTVAVLGVAKKSVYRSLPGVELYDLERDLRTFRGGMPVVAHPPCQQWSRLKAFAKKDPAEKELGLIALKAVEENGGVLEHPAGSCLLANVTPGRGAFFVVDQSWFGFEARKRTTLYVVGMARRLLPPFPYKLGVEPGKVALMSRDYRSTTVEAFAVWLLEIARCSTVGLSFPTVLGDSNHVPA